MRRVLSIGQGDAAILLNAAPTKGKGLTDAPSRLFLFSCVHAPTSLSPRTAVCLVSRHLKVSGGELTGLFRPLPVSSLSGRNSADGMR